MSVLRKLRVKNRGVHLFFVACYNPFPWRLLFLPRVTQDPGSSTVTSSTGLQRPILFVVSPLSGIFIFIVVVVNFSYVHMEEEAAAEEEE